LAAQLHQLRGRVGRGQAESLCLLLAQYTPETSAPPVAGDGRDQRRVKIAEADLTFRGRASFGTRQSGLPDFRVANIVRDSRILEIAREEAEAWLARDPDLTAPARAAYARCSKTAGLAG